MKAFLFLFLCLMIFTPGKGQPNIILIESDDQSNLGVGAFGFGTIQTPHIDAIANSGVYFTHAYNMGTWTPAVCIPSRTMLFHGIYLWEAEKINPQNLPGPSLAERLKKAGYGTYFTGKWHVRGIRPEQIFDRTGQILKGQLKTYYADEGHLTDVVGQEAVSFVKEAAVKDRPFFLYVAFNAAHVPRETYQKYYDLYPPDQIVLPPSVIDGSPLHPYIKYNYTEAPISSQSKRVHYQQNNAMITQMDEQIGEILNALKETGEYENSVVVFLSDQGHHFGEKGVQGKTCLYELSVRAPLILCGPDIPAKNIIDERIYLQDIYPTILDIAQIEIPAYMDFHSLMPLIQSNMKGKSPYESIYLGMFDDQRAIIYKNYKLILYPKAAAAELYDLQRDPWEMNNLSDHIDLQDRIRGLCQQLIMWQQETGDSIDLSIPFPGLFSKADE